MEALEKRKSERKKDVEKDDKARKMHGIWKHLKKPFYKAVLGTSHQISPAVRNFHVTLQINLLRVHCLPPW